MSFPDYVAKFRRKMVEIRSRFKETSKFGIYGDLWVPPPIDGTQMPGPSALSPFM